MNSQQAYKLLDETFNKDFKNERISNLLKDLLNTSKLYSEDKTRFISNEFKEYILNVTKLGQYEDSNKNCIELLAVKLAKHSSLGRARTMQRNFIAKWLANNSSEPKGAIVAFYDDTPDWRFSFVKLEYNLIKDAKGNLKAKKELTPARRYSFLVGINEPNHTCKRQFIDLLTNDEHDPNLEEIEHAFSIEKVTKEFFDRYKELFLRLKEELEKIVKNEPNVRKEFIRIAGDNKDDLEKFCIEFSKKLMGQIVFLYFLQKKGWLGVKKDNSGKFKEWGTGPKDFMKQLFKKEYGEYKNFFNDVLEPLFYNTLAVKRTADYSDKFNCKIPFLNGGLFEPINEYDWVNTRIYLDDGIFKDIFDTFDEFNFTVKEDEPLEKEVAVDPEMLGKVFENLLEVSDRKSKGAFYTPREIVHYMCQQSLINYIETNTSISRGDIEIFIQMGDLALDQTIKAMEHKKKYHGNTYDVDSKYLIPQTIEGNFELIDKLLADIKIVDPAVGSGAFPMGMMNEIVKARSILSLFFKDERNVYDFKRDCIENSLYGVDIMPSAVDICQLRFWLSLIVDEVDKDKVKPLPNLDNKIMCGNSLLEEFEGIKLFDESLLGETQKVNTIEEIKKLNAQMANLLKEDLSEQEYDKKYKEIEKQIKKLGKEAKKDKYTSQSSLHDSLSNTIAESKQKLIKIKQLQKEFFSEYDRDRKKSLKEKIDDLEWELIEVTLKEQGNEEALKRLDDIKKSKSKPFFLWKLYFADVFQRENPGFDVVIANPPYVFGGNKGISKEDKKSFKKNFFSGTKKINLFTIFIEQGTNLLRQRGFLTYITPNTLLRVTSYSNIREFLIKHTTLQEIIDLDVGIFENVTASTIVFSLEKKQSDLKNTIKIKRNVKYPHFNELKQKDFSSKGFVFNIFSKPSDRKIINKIKTGSKSLGSLCKYLRFGVVITQNMDDVVKERKIDSKWMKFLEGNEIGPYYINYRGRYLHYKKSLLHRSRTPDVFISRKIMVQRITGGSRPIKSTYDAKGYFNKESIINLILENNAEDHYKFILGLLNSRLVNWFYLKEYSNESKLTVNLSKEYLSEIPIKENVQIQKIIIILINQILNITKDKDYSDNSDKQSKVRKLEKEIDKLVYKLYDLTPEEIKIVEEFNEK